MNHITTACAAGILACAAISTQARAGDPDHLSNAIRLKANSYDEQTFVPALGRWVYRRTVDYAAITLQ